MDIVDIAGMLGAIMEIYATQENDISVIVDVQGKPPFRVTAMEDRLVQVFRNLIQNAISFSPISGCVQLSLSRTSSTSLPSPPDGVPLLAVTASLMEAPAEGGAMSPATGEGPQSLEATDPSGPSLPRIVLSERSVEDQLSSIHENRSHEYHSCAA